MSIFEGLIKPTIKAVISPTSNSNCNMTQTVNIENYHNHDYFGKPFFWGAVLLIGYWLVTSDLSCSPAPSPVTPPTPATFESQVRTWASDYPADIRNRWAWCYLDSVANWSTDQKLREDVRLKSVQVLTDADRKVLSPLDQQIDDAVPKQTTPLKETYQDIGNGLKVAEWLPPPDGDGRRQTTDGRKEIPKPPDRRRIIFRR